MNSFILLISILFSVPIFGQEFTFPKIKPNGKSVNDFVIPNWFIKDSTKGDLNGDHLDDLAFVLEYKDTLLERRPSGLDNEGSPRILVVLLQNDKSGLYRLLVQNNTFIIRYGEGGMDPEAYGDININNGVLNIEFTFLRGMASYKFRYQKGDLFLIGATTSGVSGGMIYRFDVNFNTKKAKIETGSISNDKMRVKWIKLNNIQLRKLRNMTEAFSWEVVKDQYI